MAINGGFNNIGKGKPTGGFNNISKGQPQVRGFTAPVVRGPQDSSNVTGATGGALAGKLGFNQGTLSNNQGSIVSASGTLASDTSGGVGGGGLS